MRRPPPFSDFHKYPATAGTILLALGVTIAWWSKIDITPIMATIDVRRWQLWRLVTSALPHVDAKHLIFNCYWTWVFGTLIEETFGHFWTIALFTLLAAISAAAEYAFLEGGVGLSGVGYGLFGMLWVLSTRDRRFNEAVDRNTVLLFVGWFFLCIVMTFMGTPIANIAHGVGAITGALLGWSVCLRGPQRAASLAALTLLGAASIAGATVARPWLNFSGLDEAAAGYDALKVGKNTEAIKWYIDATKIKPREPSYWYNLGIAYQRSDDMTNAIKSYHRALTLDPDDEKYQEAAGQ